MRAAPEGRVGTAVRSRLVNSTHSFKGRLSRRSEIISIGDWLEGEREAGFDFLGEGEDLLVFAFFFTGAC